MKYCTTNENKNIIVIIIIIIIIHRFLGTSLSVILHLETLVAIVTSASVAILYTMFGQMISVAYTDIVQLVLIVFGLVSIANVHDSFKFCNGRLKIHFILYVHKIARYRGVL